MSTPFTNDNKNTITLTGDAKGPATTWDQATYTWDQAVGTWDVPGEALTPESKNTINLTNDAKS